MSEANGDEWSEERAWVLSDLLLARRGCGKSAIPYTTKAILIVYFSKDNVPAENIPKTRHRFYHFPSI